MDNLQKVKRCSKCGVEKPLSEFGKKRSTLDGLNPYCRECTKLYYQEHKADRLAYAKERAARLRAINLQKEADEGSK